MLNFMLKRILVKIFLVILKKILLYVLKKNIKKIFLFLHINLKIDFFVVIIIGEF